MTEIGRRTARPNTHNIWINVIHVCHGDSGSGMAGHLATNKGTRNRDDICTTGKSNVINMPGGKEQR